MLTLLPRSSPLKPASLLIAAISGRALAASAIRAGLTPLVADFFADADTRALAHACRKLKGDIGRGMRWQSLGPALEALARAAPSPILGFVYGSGFEDRPHLLTRIAERWPVLGNDAATVERIKAPESFFAELDRLGIAHPLMATERPARGEGWLAKRKGGGGGSHIVPSRIATGGRDVYYQQQVTGRAVSALFVADGGAARVLGFSEQWTAPSKRSLWRYGGAVQPATLPTGMARHMASAVKRAAEAFKIKGLASADFMVRDGHALLLEINPRPGATLDVFDAGATPLLRLHLDAVIKRKLPLAGLKFDDALASSIVYAPKGFVVPPDMIWPDWVADRPKSSEWIDKNRPICTVLARAETKARAKRLVEARIRKVLGSFKSLSKGENGEQTRRREPNASDGLAERQCQGRTARPSSHR
jgi:predicted ATP-grasp superfamily ATP-dependent carboligase